MEIKNLFKITPDYKELTAEEYNDLQQKINFFKGVEQAPSF